MQDEQLFEEGVVKSLSNDGTVEVILLRGDKCYGCDNFFCKATTKGENILLAQNDLNAEIGDQVRVAITGKSVMKATFLIYMFPLFLLVVGILAGMSLFSGYPAYELWSFLLGIGLASLYYVIILSLKLNNKPTLPRIISVKKEVLQ